MRTIIQRLALMAGLAVIALLGLAPGGAGGAAADSGQEITFHAAVCPKWAIVPANAQPTEWDETGHGAELDASADTSLADEGDIPKDCDAGKGWVITLANSINGEASRKVEVNGHETITLSDDEFSVMTGGGLYVRSYGPQGLQFGGLRCFDDVSFGDNVELIWADPSAAPVKSIECVVFAVPASQQVTFIAAVCSGWAAVPANANPTEWDETGHGGELNSGADTSLADPTDIGAGCERSNGWKFSLSSSQGGANSRSVGPTNGNDRQATESLNAEEIEALSNGGLWVRSETKGDYTFAGLRCYDDVNYGDNLELIYIPRNETPKAGVYCIAFAVKHVSGEKVSPVLECVVDQGATVESGARYVAIFGYNNPNSASVHIGHGGSNKFTPGPADRGQPEDFAPGRQRSVFKVEFGNGNLVWTLNGKTSTASPNSARCSS